MAASRAVASRWPPAIPSADVRVKHLALRLATASRPQCVRSFSCPIPPPPPCPRGVHSTTSASGNAQASATNARRLDPSAHDPSAAEREQPLHASTCARPADPHLPSGPAKSLDVSYFLHAAVKPHPDPPHAAGAPPRKARPARRIAGIDLRAVAAALLQTHRLPFISQLRKDQHARTFYEATKRLSKARPGAGFFRVETDRRRDCHAPPLRRT